MTHKTSDRLREGFGSTLDDPLKFIIYTGPSMNPTLRAQDMLRIDPYDGRKIRRGDVIVFLPPGGDRKVTHRIISVDSQGIRTCGDNTRHVDPWVLSPDDIIGRVIYAQRRNRRIWIYGGLIGRLSVGPMRAIRFIDSKISLLLSPVYNWLARSGVFRRWVTARMETRIISLKRPAGTELQLLMGQCVIGRLLPENDQWQIRRPFRLFVDEASLPQQDSDHSTISEWENGREL